MIRALLIEDGGDHVDIRETMIATNVADGIKSIWHALGNPPDSAVGWLRHTEVLLIGRRDEGCEFHCVTCPEHQMTIRGRTLIIRLPADEDALELSDALDCGGWAPEELQHYAGQFKPGPGNTEMQAFHRGWPPNLHPEVAPGQTPDPTAQLATIVTAAISAGAGWPEVAAELSRRGFEMVQPIEYHCTSGYSPGTNMPCVLDVVLSAMRAWLSSVPDLSGLGVPEEVLVKHHTFAQGLAQVLGEYLRGQATLYEEITTTGRSHDETLGTIYDEGHDPSKATKH